MIRYPVRVLVVDDSAYIRKTLREILMRSPRLEVVGTARNGLEALDMVTELNPDVVTLDLFMDELDGVGFLLEQVRRHPLPVIICSIASKTGQKAVAAMEAGAVEFVRKPTALALEQVYELADELIAKVLIAASIPRERLPLPASNLPISPVPSVYGRSVVDTVVIGVSTGGPQALRYLLPRLPHDFPVPIAVVIHMPIGYTGPLAEKLNELSHLEVLEATEGMEMKPGRILLAPAGSHLVLRRVSGSVVAHLDMTSDNSLHRPSVDVLFRSAADVYGSRCLGVVMTGMGNDGTTGSAWIKSQGGWVITEAEESCVVFGMPRSVVEAGLSDRSFPLTRIAEGVMEYL